MDPKLQRQLNRVEERLHSVQREQSSATLWMVFAALGLVLVATGSWTAWAGVRSVWILIVVAPVAASKGFVESVSFHGTRLSDVLPMGQARIDGDELVSKTWTKDGPGGDDLLTVVRTSAPAYNARHSP